MNKFHIFNALFYFDTCIHAYIHTYSKREKKKKEESVIYEWSLFMRFTFFSSDTPQSKEI